MFAEKALVSVIVPVYNAESSIRRCLDSIASQCYSPLEIIAINDGSTDQSLSILQEYAHQDTRIRVFDQCNSGVSCTRNVGLQHASGTYIKFVDSDDVLPPHALSTMTQALEEHDCQIVLGAYHEVIGGSKHFRSFFKNNQLLERSGFLDTLSARPNSFYYSVLWNKLYRRDIIERHSLRFNERLIWGEDFAFNMQYLKYVDAAFVLCNPVYEYWRRIRGLAISNSLRSFYHPFRYIRMKLLLHEYYKQLYIDTGYYNTYRHILPRHLFTFTINR